MECEKFCEVEQLGPINNFRQLKRSQKVFLGDNSDLGNCKTLKAAIVDHNWPSQWHSQFSEGYILLSVNDEKKRFDLAQQTIDGKPAYIFAPTKEVERIYIVKCAEEQKTGIEARVLLNGGKQMYSNGNFWGAAQNYKKLTELDPSNGEAHSRLGHTLLKLGLHKEAVESLSRADSLHLTGWQRGQVYDDIGLANSRLGDQIGAIFWFDLSVAFWSRNAKALVHRGLSLRKTGQYDRSYTDALMALKLLPAHAPALRLKKELEASGHITPLACL